METDMTELQEKIIELRQQGKGQKAIAKQLGCTRDAVKWICEKYNLNGFLAKQPLSETDIKQKVENATQHFEYIGGWDSCDKDIYLQCRWCGNMFKHSAQFTKLGHSCVKCANCLNIARAYAEKQNKEQIEQQQIKKKKELKSQKEISFWNQSFIQMHMRECKTCGQLFVVQRKNQSTCSEICSKNVWYRNNSKKREKYRYMFPLETLSKRDKGICYLCGKPVDFTDYRIRDGIFYAGPNYPSRDHVRPQSQGGKHSWDNIRLAHFYCNTLKGVKIYF